MFNIHNKDVNIIEEIERISETISMINQVFQEYLNKTLDLFLSGEMVKSTIRIQKIYDVLMDATQKYGQFFNEMINANRDKSSGA